MGLELSVGLEGGPQIQLVSAFDKVLFILRGMSNIQLCILCNLLFTNVIAFLNCNFCSEKKIETEDTCMSIMLY